MIETPKRVALFHAYGELPSMQPEKPDKASRLQVLAASEMIKRGQVDTVVFLVGHISSKGSTKKEGLSVAEKMANQLQKNLRNVPEGTVIVKSDAFSTRDEIEDFKKLSEGQNWVLMSVGKEAHLQRIKRAVKRKFGKRSSEVAVISLEEILTQDPNRTSYKKIIDNIRNSPEELAFIKRERIINLIDSIPFFGGWFLDNLNKLPIGKIIEARAHQMLTTKKTN